MNTTFVVGMVLHLITFFYLMVRGPKDNESDSSLWAVFHYISVLYLACMGGSYIRIAIAVLINEVGG